MTPHEQATALKIVKRADLEPEDQYALIADIAAALTQRERETLEKEAKYWDEMAENKFEEMGGSLCRYLAKHYRQRAEEVGR